MENIQNAIKTIREKDAIGFKQAITNELASRLHSAILSQKESMASKLNSEEETEVSVEGETEMEETEQVDEANLIAPSAPVSGGRVGIPGSERANAGVGEVPDPLEELRSEVRNAFEAASNPVSTSVPAAPVAQKVKIPTAGSATSQDGETDLDPNFEKEFYIKEMEYKGHKVVLKQVGLGLSKPIRVYVDNKKWEFFPGQESAIKSVRSYIDEMNENEKDSVEPEVDAIPSAPTTESFKLKEKVDLDGRTKMYKSTVMRIENSRKVRETRLTNQEIMNSVNMKNGKFVMGEEELTDKQKEYRKFFSAALKKHGASSPSEMDADKKKKFFSYVKTNWKG